MGIYYIPTAAITNCLKCGDLQQTHLFLHSSWTQKSKMGFTGLNSRCQHSAPSMKALQNSGKESFFAFSSFYGLPSLLGLWPRSHHISFPASICTKYFSSSVLRSPSASLLQGHLWLHMVPPKICRAIFSFHDSQLNHLCKLPVTTYGGINTCISQGWPFSLPQQVFKIYLPIWKTI